MEKIGLLWKQGCSMQSHSIFVLCWIQDWEGTRHFIPSSTTVFYLCWDSELYYNAPTSGNQHERSWSRRWSPCLGWEGREVGNAAVLPAENLILHKTWYFFLSKPLQYHLDLGWNVYSASLSNRIYPYPLSSKSKNEVLQYISWKIALYNIKEYLCIYWVFKISVLFHFSLEETPLWFLKHKNY